MDKQSSQPSQSSLHLSLCNVQKYGSFSTPTAHSTGVTPDSQCNQDSPRSSSSEHSSRASSDSTESHVPNATGNQIIPQKSGIQSYPEKPKEEEEGPSDYDPRYWEQQLHLQRPSPTTPLFSAPRKNSCPPPKSNTRNHFWACLLSFWRSK